MTSGERLFELATGILPRLYLWREGWHAFLSAPLLGVGFGQFPWHHVQYGELRPESPLTGLLFSHTHNLLIQVMAEMGLAGAVVLMAGIGAWLWGLKQARFDVYLWWLLGLLAVIGIHSMLEYPLWYAHFLGIAALAFGATESRLIPLRIARIGPWIMAAVIALGATTAWTTVESYRRMEVLLFSRYHYPPGSAEVEWAHAALQRIHRESLLAPYIELVYAGGIEPDPQNLRQKLDLNTRVMRFAPISLVVYRQAILLALNGESGPAMEQAERAGAAYPREMPWFVRQLEAVPEKDRAAVAPLLEFARGRLKKS